MKKILLVIAAIFCVATVSAQNWAVGLRAGSGVQVDAEWFYNDKAYVEGRFGMGLGAHACHSASADFTALHNWNCCNWDWTPGFATWYLDAGCGVNVGGGAFEMYAGVAGAVKFGMKFTKVPIRLSIDYTPVFGVQYHYGKYYSYSWTCYHNAVNGLGFYGMGLANCAVSATWCF